MANNRIVVKRTSTAGRTPNTTAPANLQYIAAGELALNMTDKTFFTSDGTNLIYVGSNVNILTVSTNVATIGTGTYFVSNGNVGIGNTVPANKLSVNGTTYIGANLTIAAALIANSSAGSNGAVLISNSTGTYWSSWTSRTSFDGYTEIVSPTGSTSLSNTSSAVINITGTPSGASISLPNVTTLELGWAVTIFNSTASTIQVQTNALVNVGSGGISSGHSARFTCVALTGTTAASWAVVYEGATTRTGSGSAVFNFAPSIGNLVLTGNLTVNSSAGNAGQVLASNSAGVYWTNTVTSVATGNGMTGGTITGTGTVSVLANSGIVANATGVYVNPNTGIVANATGVYVNAAYIATLTANDADNLGTVAAANYVQNTDSRTLSGNLVISGTRFTPSANTILLGNTTQRWVLSANTGDFSSSVNAASYTVGTAFTANSTVVNAISYTIGTTLIANTLGVYHTGLVNAASYRTGAGYGAATGGAVVNTTVLATGNVTVNAVINSSALVLNGVVAGGYYKGNNSNSINQAAAGNIFRVNSNTLTASVTFAAGENGTATGPVAIGSGVSLIISTGARVSIV